MTKTSMIWSDFDCPPLPGGPPLDCPLEIERVFDPARNGWMYENAGVRSAALGLLWDEGFHLYFFDDWLEKEFPPLADGRQTVLLDRHRLLQAAAICDVEAMHFGVLYLQLLQRYVLRETFMHPLALHGRAMKQGRKQDSVGPLRKAIRRVLKQNSEATPAKVWKQMSDHPPKGMELYDNRHGKYIEIHSRTGHSSTTYASFRNAVAKEKALLFA